MITLEYDHALVEQATFLAARRDEQRECELHLAIDPIYEIPDKELRQKAFTGVFRQFFTKFGLDRVVSSLIAEQPLISECVGRCVVREAPRSSAESAELFVRQAHGLQSVGSMAARAETHGSDSRTLVVQACPQSLLDTGKFVFRMRRELLHVADMLDERFAYKREAIAGLPARQNLVRDRYRVLWDVYVQGRLQRRGQAEARWTERLKRNFRKVFGGQDADSMEPAFDRVFRAPSAGDGSPPAAGFSPRGPLTHGILLEWAGNPDKLFQAASSSRSSNGLVGSLVDTRDSEKAPGGRCPLCGFPTHDWFDFPGVEDGTIADAVRSNHPDWSIESGLCRQCAEMYAAASPTV
ncbi:MAG: hypothetical protein V3W34_08485 [Phycisphaerae bacterium]